NGTTTPPAIKAWSAVYLRYIGGSGNELRVEANLPSGVPAALVAESPTGTFDNLQQQPQP
ncbi:MAG: hypothetical protein ACK4YP_24850, partial [Myxococcota bacterium]